MEITRNKWEKDILCSMAIGVIVILLSETITFLIITLK